MLARLRMTGLVLAIVVFAYLAYTLAVVPFIEPSVRFAAGSQGSTPGAERKNRFDSYFPAGSWERGRPKVIETDRGTLLFADYQPLPDGKVKLTRCTVIAYVNESQTPGAASREERQEPRPIIIQAPQGATLTFDQSSKKLNLLQGDFGRLVGGLLEGPITIHSPPSQPDANDRLEIVTRNVQIDTNRIWTPHEVRFRYGTNSGSGRVLTIHLANTKKKSPQSPAGLDMHGVRTVELLHLDRMDLAFNGQGLFGQARPASGTARASPEPNAPNVEVRCQGPLRFDVVRQMITLEDQVNLTRSHPGGAQDQLLCQLLEIHFDRRNRSAPANDPFKPVTSGEQTAALRPTRVVATGTPVTVRAAAVGMGARAERIEYDCILQRVWLNDRDKVLLHDQHHRVEAKEVRYAVGERNRLGELFAVGPGTLRGQFEQENRPFEVSWQHEVHLQRMKAEHVLSFDKRVTVVVNGMGRISGDTLHLYLREVPRPGAPDRFDPVPDRVHLVGHVDVDTLNCHGTLDEAKIWFQAKSDQSPVASQTPQDAPGAGLFDPLGGPAAADRQASKYEVTAGIVEAVVLMGDRPVVDLVIVRGSVHVQETTVGVADPLVIRGDHFELQDGASEHPRAALLGAPAEIVSQGGSARGPKIYLHPRDNYLEIDGAGDLHFIAQQAAVDSGREAAPTTIEWRGKMQFDGQMARFEQDVAIRGTEWSQAGEKTTFVAKGDVVHAVLDKAIDFQNAQESGPVDLSEAAFEGWGFLQAESWDLNGERKLFEQMQVLALTVNRRTGEIRGQGPGWVRGVHRSGDLAVAEPASAEVPGDVAGGNLSFVRVDFQREIVGNLNDQRLEFLNGTKTIYGPVASWDDSLDGEDGPSRPGVVRLTSDRLAVSQPSQGPRGAFELEAVGNAHVQGESFSATGGRVSYVRAKDQLILEGDGRNDAKIEFQLQPGARPSFLAAGKLLYWPKTRQCQIIDWRPSELYDLGQVRTREAPAVRPR